MDEAALNCKVDRYCFRRFKSHPLELEVEPPEQDLLRREPHQLFNGFAFLQKSHESGGVLQRDAVEQEPLESWTRRD